MVASEPVGWISQVTDLPCSYNVIIILHSNGQFYILVF